ncbi:MAG: hypothetical protein RL077_4290, partial [Verrucomicrobiota bacterium]
KAEGAEKVGLMGAGDVAGKVGIHTSLSDTLRF